MATTRNPKQADTSRPAKLRKSPIRGRAGQQQTRAVKRGSTERDEDIEAQQHEIHGMIEDAMDPLPERGGTDIERE